jgi:uncharacterized membrane protein
MTSRRNTVRSRPGPSASSAALPLPGTTRVDVVDAARGFAVAMMIAYHFCFDLTFYGWAHWPMLDDARWIAWRSTIVGCFVFMVGVSLALRDARERERGAGWFDRGFVRRWAQIAGAALLVTAGSAALFPKTFIYFGVLHFVAVALWLCRRAPRLGGWAIAAGCVVTVIGLLVSSPAFDPKAIDWIGFAAEKPLTEDYVPLFPWLGVVMVGCGVGALWGRRGFRLSPAAAAAWTAVPAGLRRLAAAMGRWSLAIYLLHQPLMLGILGLVKQLA